jgi:hypothetical protein
MAMGLVSSIVVSGQFVLLSRESLNWLRYSGGLFEFIALVKNLTQLALTSLFSLSTEPSNISGPIALEKLQKLIALSMSLSLNKFETSGKSVFMLSVS